MTIQEPKKSLDEGCGNESLAVEAVRRARRWFEAAGDPVDFQAFEAFLLYSSDARTYAEVGQALGMSAPEVRTRVERVRVRIRAELRQILSPGRD
jgi:DNA-directed RNA polymerase specialized sigma24 family protein